jgi:hypothetical protein
MMRRALFSLAVLTAALYWADCDYNPRILPTPVNTFFAGCFKTTAAAQGFDEIIVVLEASEQSGETLGGCLRRRLGNDIENGTVAGLVAEPDRLRAEVTVTAPRPRTDYMLRVQRAPVINVPAENVTLINVGGAPFATAVDVPRCDPQQTCAELGIPIPFLPGGGTP